MKLIASIIAVASLSLTGCVTSKQTSATGQTTTVINQNNLTLDSAAAQVATAVAVTAALNATHNDPQVVSALKNAQTALGGILNGTSQQTTQQVIELLKAQGNPALSAQVTSLVNALSAAEQQLIAKYGQSIGGQITIALTRAVYSGLSVGLAGQ